MLNLKERWGFPAQSFTIGETKEVAHIETIFLSLLSISTYHWIALPELGKKKCLPQNVTG